jgi:NAD+ kinase
MRSIALSVNWTKPAAVAAATQLCELLAKQQVAVYAIAELNVPPISNCNFIAETELPELEAVIVIGGDGTILRSAELARQHDLPLLGINHGHVGFLAEAEATELVSITKAIADRSWWIEERLTLEVCVIQDGSEIWRSWGLNEISIEKATNARIAELITAVDDHPLSRYAGDGVIVATPTGSTAYAFSAGGPVVWPSVNAVVLVPLSAHSLFARPLVISPESSVVIELISPASVWADSRRGGDIPAGARILIKRSQQPIKFLKLNNAPFTDRLVKKFELPTSGWRGVLGEK